MANVANIFGQGTAFAGVQDDCTIFDLFICESVQRRMNLWVLLEDRSEHFVLLALCFPALFLVLDGVHGRFLRRAIVTWARRGLLPQPQLRGPAAHLEALLPPLEDGPPCI